MWLCVLVFYPSASFASDIKNQLMKELGDFLFQEQAIPMAKIKEIHEKYGYFEALLSKEHEQKYYGDSCFMLNLEFPWQLLEIPALCEELARKAINNGLYSEELMMELKLVLQKSDIQMDPFVLFSLYCEFLRLEIKSEEHRSHAYTAFFTVARTILGAPFFEANRVNKTKQRRLFKKITYPKINIFYSDEKLENSLESVFFPRQNCAAQYEASEYLLSQNDEKKIDEVVAKDHERQVYEQKEKAAQRRRELQEKKIESYFEDEYYGSLEYFWLMSMYDPLLLHRDLPDEEVMPVDFLQLYFFSEAYPYHVLPLIDELYFFYLGEAEFISEVIEESKENQDWYKKVFERLDAKKISYKIDEKINLNIVNLTYRQEKSRKLAQSLALKQNRAIKDIDIYWHLLPSFKNCPNNIQIEFFSRMMFYGADPFAFLDINFLSPLDIAKENNVKVIEKIIEALFEFKEYSLSEELNQYLKNESLRKSPKYLWGKTILDSKYSFHKRLNNFLTASLKSVHPWVLQDSENTDEQIFKEKSPLFFSRNCQFFGDISEGKNIKRAFLEQIYGLVRPKVENTLLNRKEIKLKRSLKKAKKTEVKTRKTTERKSKAKTKRQPLKVINKNS